MLERKNHRLICIWPKTEKNRDRKAGVPQEPQVLRISRITRTDQALSSERVPLLSHYRLPMAVAHAETAKEREESARAREGVLPGRWRTVWISKAFGIHGPAIHHPTVSRPLSEAPGTFARLDLLPSALVMNHRRGGRGANWPCVAVARNLLRSVALTTHAVLSGEAHSFIARIVVVYSETHPFYFSFSIQSYQKENNNNNNNRGANVRDILQSAAQDSPGQSFPWRRYLHLAVHLSRPAKQSSMDDGVYTRRQYFQHTPNCPFQPLAATP